MRAAVLHAYDQPLVIEELGAPKLGDDEVRLQIDFSEEKKLCGCAYGSSQNRRDFQRYIDLAESGRLDVASMVSRRIALDDVNDAFRAMEAGEVIRSVIY